MALDFTGFGRNGLANTVQKWLEGIFNSTTGHSHGDGSGAPITFTTAQKTNHIVDASAASGEGNATASLDVGVVGDNNAITIDALLAGSGGNGISLTFTVPELGGQSISITRVDTAISVALGTGDAGVSNTTATDLIAAINGSEVANDLIFMSNTGASDGTGIVGALGATALAGGKDAATVTGAEYNALVNKVNAILAAGEKAGFIKSS